tara:strand:- start:571 stop:810 length:240 start_codon:yes stop_codon:yes gene_type:complete
MLGLASGLTYQGTVIAAAIEDYMWELDGDGDLRPLYAGTVSDFHDTWDLDGTDYKPQEAPGDEGYWDLDGNTDLQPLDV